MVINTEVYLRVILAFGLFCMSSAAIVMIGDMTTKTIKRAICIILRKVIKKRNFC